jgi:hypothetical protein
MTSSPHGISLLSSDPATRHHAPELRASLGPDLPSSAPTAMVLHEQNPLSQLLSPPHLLHLAQLLPPLSVRLQLLASRNRTFWAQRRASWEPRRWMPVCSTSTRLRRRLVRRQRGRRGSVTTLMKTLLQHRHRSRLPCQSLLRPHSIPHRRDFHLDLRATTVADHRELVTRKWSV